MKKECGRCGLKIMINRELRIHSECVCRGHSDITLQCCGYDHYIVDSTKPGRCFKCGSFIYRPCDHDWKMVELFTSKSMCCTKCGKEK